MTQDVKKILKISALAIFFIAIISYALFRSSDLIFGVKIRDVNITDGTKVPNSVLEITGNAKNATNLYLNGREISVDQEGNFRETVVLTHGYNVINIKAKDKFGHEDENNYQLIY